MRSIVLIPLLLAGATRGRDPMKLKGIIFYDAAMPRSSVEAPAALSNDSAVLVPSVEFVEPGHVRTRDEYDSFDGKDDRFTSEFSDGGWTLTNARSPGKKYSWRWIDAEHAETNLTSELRVMTSSRPNAQELRDAFAEHFAASRLPKGKYVHGDKLVFELGADGGVRWGPKRGRFFECTRGEWGTPDDGLGVCLSLPGLTVPFNSVGDGERIAICHHDCNGEKTNPNGLNHSNAVMFVDGGAAVPVVSIAIGDPMHEVEGSEPLLRRR